MKYRKKPVVIEAIEWTGENFDEVKSWRGKADQLFIHYVNTDDLVIPTLEGDMHADVGDFIIRGVQGEFYPCKPDIFAETYEPVDDWNRDDGA